MLVLYYSQYNHLQRRQKAKELIVHVGIKHSHIYNWKLYFLNISVFWFKISTFGSNRNDHILNQTRNSESGMLMHDHGVWFTTLDGLIFIKTVSMPKFSLPPWLELAYISPLQAKPYIEAACCLKNDLANHPPPPTPHKSKGTPRNLRWT